MLSVLRASSPQQINETRQKSKTALGRSVVRTNREAESHQTTLPFTGNLALQTPPRRSIGYTATRTPASETSKSARSSVSDTPFFEEDAVTVVKPAEDVPNEMRNGTAPRSMPTRRLPLRLDGQDGPWAVSVAETPHDAMSYSLYIKSESI